MNRRILYVEDDQDDFLLLQKAFNDVSKDIELINVSNGQSTLKYLKNIADKALTPSLIILDLNMPVMDGRETLQKLRMDTNFKNIPVVFFSTSASPADKKFIENAGTELMIKPSIYEEWKAIAQRLSSLYCLFYLYSAL